MFRLLLIALSIIILDLLALFTLYKVLHFTFLDSPDLKIGDIILFNRGVNPVKPFAILVAIYLVKNVLTYFLFKKQIAVSQKLATSLIERKFNRLLFAGVTETEQKNSMDVVNEMSQVTNHLNDRIILPSVLIIAESTLVVIVAIGAAVVNLKVLLALVLITVPLTLILIRMTRKGLETHGRQLNEIYPALYRDISTTVLANPEVEVWQNQPWIHGRFMQKVGDMFKLRKKIYLVSGVLSPRILELSILFSLLLISLILMDAPRTELLSVLTLFAAIAFRLLPSVNRIVNSQNSIRAHAYLLDVSDRADTDSVRPLNEPLSEFRMENVHVQRAGKEILSKVNIRLSKGETIGIGGPSGAGKSTLSMAICGLIEPSSGYIYVNGNPTLEHKSRVKRISLVRQDPFLMHGSIAENICFGLEMDGEKLLMSLTTSSLDELMHAFPDRERTLLGEGGKNLSGGEAQRVAIARAIYKSADVLIFDESFSDLNTNLRDSILHKIRQSSPDQIIVLISHDQELLKRCDRRYQVNNATIVETNS